MTSRTCFAGRRSGDTPDGAISSVLNGENGIEAMRVGAALVGAISVGVSFALAKKSPPETDEVTGVAAEVAGVAAETMIGVLENSLNGVAAINVSLPVGFVIRLATAVADRGAVASFEKFTIEVF